MKKHRILQQWGMRTLILVIGLAALHSSVGGAESTTINKQYPISTVKWLPCANGGVGEWVNVEGTIHELIHVTQDENGGLVFEDQINPQEMVGIGAETGDVYHVTGNEIFFYHSNPGMIPFEGNFQTTLHMVGLGTGADAWFRIHYHITINANGDFVTEVVQIEYVCD